VVVSRWPRFHLHKSRPLVAQRHIPSGVTPRVCCPSSSSWPSLSSGVSNTAGVTCSTSTGSSKVARKGFAFCDADTLWLLRDETGEGEDGSRGSPVVKRQALIRQSCPAA
jgi:hypothetical protein